ncbi:MAG: glutamine-synthetase adenylyltransferase [Pseudomonadota bacterium]
MRLADHITRLPRAVEPLRGQDVAAPYDLSGPVHELIIGAAGTSPYLCHLLDRERDWAAQAMADINAARAALLTFDADGFAELRQAKRRAALLTALCDLGGAWSLGEVTGFLSAFADHVVERALGAELRPLIKAGKVPADHGLFVLAMGKHGAGELNYSSDIDLVVLFDDAGLTPVDAGERRRHLVRAMRGVVKRLSEVTADGYVFRTDLRLRPDAAVTPIVMSTSAAEAYYESAGRTWERAAYIKARVAAGDQAAGARFLAAMAPFIWRRHLDFAAIEDAHSMILKIRDHRGLHGPITLPGHDMKLGRGGIREIEFLAQTRQLISGGRDPRLRPSATRAALEALTGAGWLAPDTAATLDAAYVSHREVEHRLQMMRDAQTHALPHSEEGFERLAALMGLERPALEARLTQTLEDVHAATEPFFAPEGPRDTPSEPQWGEDVTAAWGRYPALRSERAQRLFERLRPDILARLQDAADPERALRHFDAFLAGLPAGVQVFSLFEANRQLLDLVIDIASIAPALAQHLGRNAAVIDAVLAGQFFSPWPGAAALSAEFAAAMARHADYETQLNALRGTVREWHFRVGVHHLRGLTTSAEAGQQYADLAEAVLAAVFPVVCADMAARHGPPPGQGAAVVAMGSLGAGRLHATSDLDLLLIYDAAGQESSTGARPLATRAYYARLTQRLITALQAPMEQGRLYEVDMRLRPSGRNGPLATSLAAFESYQRNDAWTWEHLALTRARAVAGTAEVRAAVEAVRCALIAAPREPAQVATDVADMRARIFAARPGIKELDAKDGPGRMQDLELFAQTLALLAGSDRRDVAGQLAAGQGAGTIDAGALDTLLAHAALLWHVRSVTRLVLKPGQSADALPGISADQFLAREMPPGATSVARALSDAATDIAKAFEACLVTWQAAANSGSRGA